MNMELLRESIKQHEGFRSKPYRDSVGVLTIGYGYNLESGMTRHEASLLMDERIIKSITAAKRMIKGFEKISDARKRVITEMIYQLGPEGFSKFKKTIAFVEAGEHEEAAREMLDSKWARQVPKRAHKLSETYAKG